MVIFLMQSIGFSTNHSISVPPLKLLFTPVLNKFHINAHPAYHITKPPLLTSITYPNFQKIWPTKYRDLWVFVSKISCNFPILFCTVSILACSTSLHSVLFIACRREQMFRYLQHEMDFIVILFMLQRQSFYTKATKTENELSAKLKSLCT